MSYDFSKTEIQVVAVDIDDMPAECHVPGVGDVPRMKDSGLIGRRCIIHSSLLGWPKGDPVAHVIIVEGDDRYYCEPDLIGVIGD